MLNKAYIITFDKSMLDGFNYTKFHTRLTTATGVVNWWHHLESTYIIIVANNVTAKSITDFVIMEMPNKRFFVCELRLNNYNGWLDPKAWDWINQQIVPNK